MKFGLSNEQYGILDRLLFKPLTQKSAQVYVFGSRARGQHHPFSDIDVLYIESKDFPVSDAELASIKETLEESNLTIKVDLVNDQHLAPSFRPSVERDRVLVNE